MSTPSKSWIQSFTGQKIEPLALAPDPEGKVGDIAHALTLKNRFTGHTRVPYSVAQHTLIGSQLIAPAFALPFLLHEVSEVYLPDVSAPMKPAVYVKIGEEFIPWNEFEGDHSRAILAAIGLTSLLPLLTSPEVKHMDLAMLAAEKRDLMGPEPHPWGLTVEAVAESIHPMDWEDVERAWLKRFYQLTGRVHPGQP